MWGGATAEGLRQRAWTADDMKQVMPVFENLVVVEYLNGGEEPVVSRESYPGVLPQFTDLIARGMESEGHQVESEQQIGQTIFTTSGIMFHVIATVFQKVEPLIFKFPSDSGTVGQLLDIVFIDLQRSGKTILIGEFFVPVANDPY